MDEDFFVENILMGNKKKKKINTGRKGKSREREVAKILNERFGGGFSRTVSSGGRTKMVTTFLPKHAQDTFSGDLVTPEGFAFSIESKGGYNDVDLVSVFDGGHTQIDEFLKQAQFDADGCHKKPMVVWKKNHKPTLAIIRTADLPKREWEYKLTYKDWSVVSFDELLKEDNGFWFAT